MTLNPFRPKPLKAYAMQYDGTAGGRQEIKRLAREWGARYAVAPDGNGVKRPRFNDRIVWRHDWILRDLDGSVKVIDHDTFMHFYEPYWESAE